jgi:hypothetical protein
MGGWLSQFADSSSDGLMNLLAHFRRKAQTPAPPEDMGSVLPPPCRRFRRMSGKYLYGGVPTTVYMACCLSRPEIAAAKKASHVFGPVRTSPAYDFRQG